MVNLNQSQINKLLKLIKDPKERSIVEKFLLDLIQIDPSSPMPAKINIVKKKSAKKALDILSRIGLEMGKHKLIEWFFHLFD